ncbi:nitrate transporter [Coprinopsis marcescibilis]|uniref:Nitrate/nitrite transporter n=1 Tax=Coprinopsis marcescibilis TaxID=230819 RepID=A0A5C3KM18_COPMA|nr:nitrate transporter [Coprinopsis marcescibilis]
MSTSNAPPAFKWSHLWQPAIVNPVNLKSYTIPFFNLRDPYAQSFHLSWLGFFVAFLSWFAFPPLIPEAIKSDLKLTNAQVANSNVIALTATLGVRVVVGPLVDRYGPRKVMAWLLILGAIPSGLAGTARSAESLYVLRFFIGILGGTFVPCQAWTSAFFDKNCVGTANAIVGGWGNMGGGATFAIMTSLYTALRNAGLTEHIAWRVSFAAVPAPVLLAVAALTLMFGQDHPAGKWSERYSVPATGIIVEDPEIEQEPIEGKESLDEKKDIEASKKSQVGVTIAEVDDEDDQQKVVIKSTVDIAVNQPLTVKSAWKIIANHLTWLPALAYLTTFGFELALDAFMADVLYKIYNGKIDGFNQEVSGYYTSIFGFLNLVTRPFGGYVGDVVYRKYGTKGKKWWTLVCGLLMAGSCIGGGFYLTSHREASSLPSLSIVMAVFSVAAIFSELGNGANFALVPHCNAYNNGVMSGIVGSFGNLGGIIFAMIFRFQPQLGNGFWIMGIICLVLNLVLIPIPVPKF